MKKILAIVLLFTASLAGAQSTALNSIAPVFKPASFSFTANGTKTLSIGGMVGAVIVTSGTFTGFTFNVTASNDNTNFFTLPIVAGLIGGAPAGAAAAQPVTAANPAVWSTNVGALTQIKVQAICTACTGTVVFQITAQAVKQ